MVIVMLLVRLESLRPDMTLAQPVLHPDRDDLILLNKGFVLDAEMISKLDAMDMTHVWISVLGFDEIQVNVNERVCRDHMQLYQVLNRSIHDLEPRVAVAMNVPQYQDAVHRMLGGIIAQPNHEVVTCDLMRCGPLLAGHMANCTYLALLLGARLGGYLRDQRRALPANVAENTEQLGLGALLHDIGKLNMRNDWHNRTILDEDAESTEYRFHVRPGYEAVREHVSPIAANVVLHHHERFDGSGFPGYQGPTEEQPRPCSGTQIHVFSRIIAVVDAFDRLLCTGGRHAPAVVAIHALKSQRFKGWFDPTIVEGLLRLIPPFMIGSVVRLSNGTEAAVVANHPEAPCQPTVCLLATDSNSPKAGTRQLDLRMCSDLCIAEVDGVDVRSCLYTSEFEPDAASAA